MTQSIRNGVQVKNLSWTPFASPKPLLNDISFALQSGERALLIGPSGSGKSTLLRAIAAVLLDNESGQLQGEIRADTSGLLLQDPNDSLVSSTIYREVMFGAECAGIDASLMPSMAVKSLNSVGLDKNLEHSSTDLSGGEMQRMALAGVVSVSPSLLLLDEPTSMLDFESANLVREAVRSELESSKATLILVEHQFAEWLPLVDRLLVLNKDGQLVLDGPPLSILEEHSEFLIDLGIWVPGAANPTPMVLPVDSANPRGKLIAFTGKSGAGKTTELKRLMRLDKNSKSIFDGVGYVSQQAELTIIGNTVLDSVSVTAKLVARGKGLPEDTAIERVKFILASLKISHLDNQNPYEVSGGEQRRVALATALAHDPLSLYLDEPTVGQDRESWSAITGAILYARDSGMDVFIATHDPVLLTFADEIIEVVPNFQSQAEQPAKLSGLATIGSSLFLLLASMKIETYGQGLVAGAACLMAILIMAISGLKSRSLKVLIPVMLGIASVGFSNWYLSEQLNWESGATAALRVAFFAIPGVLLASQIRPIPFGDQLGQVLRLPARPVVAAMVGLQRIEHFVNLSTEIRFIYEIRGVLNSKKPLSRLTGFSSMIFALLVQAIRGAGNTAVAMDARGFSSQPVINGSKRTWASRAKYGQLDWLLVLVTLLVSTVPFLVQP